MGTAVDPVVAFAVLETEFPVEGWSPGCQGFGSHVNRRGHFEVFAQPGRGVHGEWQERHWHRRVENGARGDAIGELIEGILAKNFINGNRGALVDGVRVFDQDAGQRGEGAADRSCRRAISEVEVVAQGIALAAKQDGMFLIRVVADFTNIRLVVDGARGDGGSQAAGAFVRSHDNLLGKRHFKREVVDAEGLVADPCIQVGAEAELQTAERHIFQGAGLDLHPETLVVPKFSQKIPVAACDRGDAPRVSAVLEITALLDHVGDLGVWERLINQLLVIEIHLEFLVHVPGIDAMEGEVDGDAGGSAAIDREGFFGGDTGGFC